MDHRLHPRIALIWHPKAEGIGVSHERHVGEQWKGSLSRKDLNLWQRQRLRRIWRTLLFV